MRRTLLTLALAGVVLIATPASSETYYVVLEDGSWVRAAEKPVVENGVAQVRLPGGLLARLDSADINWERSDDRSSQADVLFAVEPGTETPMPQPLRQIDGTVTMVGTPASAEEISEGGGAAAAPAPTPDAARSIRERVSTLDSALGQFQAEKRDLEAKAHTSVSLDDAAKLREQVAQMDQQIQRIRSERERLLRELWQIQNQTP